MCAGAAVGRRLATPPLHSLLAVLDGSAPGQRAQQEQLLLDEMAGLSYVKGPTDVPQLEETVGQCLARTARVSTNEEAQQGRRAGMDTERGSAARQLCLPSLLSQEHPDTDAVVSLHQGVRLTYRWAHSHCCSPARPWEAIGRAAPLISAPNVTTQHPPLRCSDFYAQVGQVARGLLALGVQRSDRVGIWAPNCAEWVVLQFATARVGAILVSECTTQALDGLLLWPKQFTVAARSSPPASSPAPLQVNINPAYRASELSYALTQAGVSMLVLAPGLRGGREFVGMLDGVRGQLPRLQRCVLLGDDTPEGGSCVHLCFGLWMGVGM